MFQIKRSHLHFLSFKPLKLVDKFKYLESSNSYPESDMHIGKAWTATDWLSIIWKSDLSDEIKWDLFQALVVSVLLH